jgi:Flp pilus assembly protein TadD
MITAQRRTACRISTVLRVTTIVVAGFALGACAQIGGPGGSASLGLGEEKPAPIGDASPSKLGEAITYWGTKYSKEPANKKAALSYAKNLKAAGQKKKAFHVLQQASVIHGDDREIASEYGRLALENDQVELAAKLLALADDPFKPDWRVVSGRGAALAKLGRYAEAVEMFERAHKLAPSNPSVLNNLAMAHAGNSDLKAAEALLKQAAQNPMARDKVMKNLALVLQLQGRKAEAQALAQGGADALRRSLEPTEQPASIKAVAQATRR